MSIKSIDTVYGNYINNEKIKNEGGLLLDKKRWSFYFSGRKIIL